jgi:hypothetical protein
MDHLSGNIHTERLATESMARTELWTDGCRVAQDAHIECL